MSWKMLKFHICFLFLHWQRLCQYVSKALVFLIVLCVSYRWVHFSRAVLIWFLFFFSVWDPWGLMLRVLSNHGLVLITIYTSTYPRNSTLPQSDSVTGLYMLCVYVSGVVRKCVCFASEVSIKKRECFMDLYPLFQRPVHLHQRCRAYLWNDLQLARTECEGNLCLNSLNSLLYFPSVFPSFHHISFLIRPASLKH